MSVFLGARLGSGRALGVRWGMGTGKGKGMGRVFYSHWFHKGLKFKCTGCGACCKRPGYVWLEEKDIVNISNYLNTTPATFIEQHVRNVDWNDNYAFKDPEDGTSSCRFLDPNNKCTIYPVRPTQCQTYPFWRGVVDTPQNWHKEKKQCEGIEHPSSPLIENPKILQEFNRSNQSDLSISLFTTDSISKYLK